MRKRRNGDQVVASTDLDAGTEPTRTFLELVGHLALNDLMSDWTPRPLDAESDPWCGFPPDDFLDFVRQYPATPFDPVPPLPTYKRPPSFLVSQVHRIWRTAEMIQDELKARDARTLLDLGSYPFFVPLMLRDYFGFSGRIVASSNVSLSPAQLELLEAKDIELITADLDPYVHDPSQQSPPFGLPFGSGSVDAVCAAHVIEHLYHPLSLVTECARVVADDGFVMLTTDNAMMVETFENYVAGFGFIFEPIENTAAMTFSNWRGHVRFFTEQDLTTLLGAVGLSVDRVEYSHMFYDVLFDEFFEQPQPTLPGWKRQLVATNPWLRNDIAMVMSPVRDGAPS